MVIAPPIREAMMVALCRDVRRTAQFTFRESARSLQFAQNKKRELVAVVLDSLLTVEHAQGGLTNLEKS